MYFFICGLVDIPMALFMHSLPLFRSGKTVLHFFFAFLWQTYICFVIYQRPLYFYVIHLIYSTECLNTAYSAPTVFSFSLLN